MTEAADAHATTLTFSGRAMGSPLRLTISGRDREAWDARRATAAWTAVCDEFEASEQAMSRFRESSEITVLNSQAGRTPVAAVSRRLRRALVACDRANRVTAGRFDPRVLWDLERLGDRGAPLGIAPPDDAEHIAARRGRIVERTPDGLVLPVPVDLGGIGKGLALRWAATAVRRCGIGAFMLDAGGDIVAAGEAPEGGPWRIGVEDPTGGIEPLAVILAAGEAVTTSSIRRRTWQTGDRIVHHLIDPRTGEPGGAGLLAVTVIGTDPAWAEVWSKSLFLEGRVGIAALARRHGLAAWWIADDRSVEMTAAARARTFWTAGEAG